MREKKDRFKVLEGGTREGSLPRSSGRNKKVVYIVIGILAGIITLQIFASWLYTRVGTPALETIIVEHTEVARTFEAAGLIQRQEKVLFAPFSGYFKPVAEEGQRIPAGGELAKLLDAPEMIDEQKTGEPMERDKSESMWTRFISWLRSTFIAQDQVRTDKKDRERNDALEEALPSDRSGQWESIDAPHAGLVSYIIDGKEDWGRNGFVYLSPEEYTSHKHEPKKFQEGKYVQKGEPLAKLIDNFRWHYSIVLPAEKGKILAAKEQVQINFKTDEPAKVTAELVDLQTDGSVYKLSYLVTQGFPAAFQERWLESDIIYGYIEGTLLPSEAVMDENGKQAVFIVQRGKAVRKEVEIMKKVEEDKILVSDLPRGTIVILQPQNVREGQILD